MSDVAGVLWPFCLFGTLNCSSLCRLEVQSEEFHDIILRSSVLHSKMYAQGRVEILSIQSLLQ